MQEEPRIEPNDWMTDVFRRIELPRVRLCCDVCQVPIGEAQPKCSCNDMVSDVPQQLGVEETARVHAESLRGQYVMLCLACAAAIGTPRGG